LPDFGSAFGSIVSYFVVVVTWWLALGVSIEWIFTISMEVHMVAGVNVDMGMLAALWGPKG
jgi:hypothetical protein